VIAPPQHRRAAADAVRMMSMIGGAAIGSAIGFAVARMLEQRRQRLEPDARAILGLLYELYYLARADGVPALEAEVARWDTSPVFRRFPSVADDEQVRAFLIVALRLLVEHGGDEGLDLRLTEAVRAQRPRKDDADRDASERRARTIDCVRRSVLSMSRGVPVKSATADGARGPGSLTRALARLARPVKRPVAAPASSPRRGA
jgi:hypothetical protein